MLESLLTPENSQLLLPLLLLSIVLLLLSPFLEVAASFVEMVFESFGLGFLWRSAGISPADERSRSGSSSSTHKKKVRTRADQLKQSGRHSTGEEEESSPSAVYPGLINMSGTYCFLNSTLQALASLGTLRSHLDEVHEKAERSDVPTPVIDALREMLTVLNTPSSHHISHRPTGIISALSQPSHSLSPSYPFFKRTSSITLFSSREHQDAQELFQLVSELLKEESLAVDWESRRDRGLAFEGFKRGASGPPGKSPFDGLTANRRSCVECGYTEAVIHHAFDNLQVTVPRAAYCRLEDCLAEYTRLELLSDCLCTKCSLLATLRKLSADVGRVSIPSESPESPNGHISSSRKKRIRQAKAKETRLKELLEHGQLEEDIEGIKLEKVYSKCSTKQMMIARPPSILALHLNRSTYSLYASKNSCDVIFPEYLDLTPFTTNGTLSMRPEAPISASTATSEGTKASGIYYRLASVVCHYGAHSFGHYVAFRRIPSSNGRWLRISDDSVSEVTINRVLSENAGAAMLFYERIEELPRQELAAHSPSFLQQSLQTIQSGEDLLDVAASVGDLDWARRMSSRSSEETVRPNHSDENVSTREEERSPTPTPKVKEKVAIPRVVRRATIGLRETIRTRQADPSVSNTAPSPSPSHAPSLSTGSASPSPSPYPATPRTRTPSPASRTLINEAPSTEQESGPTTDKPAAQDMVPPPAEHAVSAATGKARSKKSKSKARSSSTRSPPPSQDPSTRTLSSQPLPVGLSV